MSYDNIIAITVLLAIIIACILAMRPSAKRQADFLHFWRTGEVKDEASLLDRAKAKLARNTGTIEDDSIADRVAAKMAKLDREATERMAKINTWIDEQKRTGQLPKPHIRLSWYITPRNEWLRRWTCDSTVVLPVDFRVHVFVGGDSPRHAYGKWVYKYAEKMMKARNLL